MGRAATARTAPARRAPARRAPARSHPPRRRSAPARKPARRASGHSKARTTARPRGARILDALLTGRGCIAVVGVLLVGIVFFNVDLLQMNRDITSMADRASQLKRENARLRIDLARLASSERIQETALGLGLVYPAPGEVRYLKSQPTVDAKNASKRMSAPDPNYVTPIPTPTTADPSATAPDGTATTDPTATDPTATDDTATDETTSGPVDPATGLPVDPATGQTVYSPTGEPLDPATGLPLSPE
jgi:cell division protein FtsL